jgi:hypothetical protein
MDVTRDNFVEVYPQFKALLDTCKYFAFDEEMTGILGIGDMQQKRDDTVQLRYQKMVEVATKYSIIQFGVCLFHDSNDGKSVVATPFNFYVFPNGGGDLVMSPSSIDFLRKNNMNFDTWLSKGITYVDEKGEEKLRSRFYPPATAEPKSLIVLSRQSDIEYTEKSMSAVTDMLATAPNSDVSEPLSITLQPANSYLRRVLYEQLEARFLGAVSVTKNDAGHMVVARVDASQLAAHEEAKKIEKERQFYDSLGFRRVFSDLIAAKKPIIGHNLFFDLLFMMRWFDGALPADFEDFRRNLNDKFPFIYDTKYIAELAPDGVKMDSTTLEVCFDHYVKVQVGVEIKMSALITDYDASKPQYHNAGYDAYATGCVFTRQLGLLAHALKDGKGLDQVAANPVGLDEAGVDAGAVPAIPAAVRNVCENTIMMMRSFYHAQLNPAVPAGAFALPGALVRVSGFDGASTNNSAVTDALTTAGLVQGSYEVLWVDKESFFVHFPKHALGDTREGEQRTEQALVPLRSASEGSDSSSAMSVVDTNDAAVAEQESSEGAPVSAPATVWVAWPAAWTVETLSQYERKRARDSVREMCISHGSTSLTHALSDAY